MKEKNKVFMVRFSDEDWDSINKIAKKNRTWSATWIREVVINELIRLGKRKGDASIGTGVREKGRKLRSDS